MGEFEFNFDDYRYGAKAISMKYQQDVWKMEETLQWAKDFMDRYERKHGLVRFN